MVSGFGSFIRRKNLSASFPVKTGVSLIGRAIIIKSLIGFGRYKNFSYKTYSEKEKLAINFTFISLLVFKSNIISYEKVGE